MLLLLYYWNESEEVFETVSIGDVDFAKSYDERFIQISQKGTTSNNLLTSTFNTSCHKVSLNNKTVYLRKSEAQNVNKEDFAEILNFATVTNKVKDASICSSLIRLQDTTFYKRSFCNSLHRYK